MDNLQHLLPAEQEEYERLSAEAARIRSEMKALENKPVKYGYLRVSSRGQAREGNSLEAQREALQREGAQVFYTDVYTGTKTDRPELDKLLAVLKDGDTLMVTKLDRIARTLKQGLDLFDRLLGMGVRVHVLNMGMIDSTPTGRLILGVMLGIAEFERDMIMQRTREGREIARQKPDHREGRKPKFEEDRIKHAMDLRKEGYSFNEVARRTGISKTTLIRITRKARDSTIMQP